MDLGPFYGADEMNDTTTSTRKCTVSIGQDIFARLGQLLPYVRKERAEVPCQRRPDDGNMVAILRDGRTDRVLQLQTLRTKVASATTSERSERRLTSTIASLNDNTSSGAFLSSSIS